MNSSNEEIFMLNIGHSLVVEKIANFYIEKGISNIILAVNDEHPFHSFRAFCKVNIKSIGITLAPLETLERTIRDLSSDIIIVNPITTIPTYKFDELDIPSIVYGEESIPKENWSALIEDNLAIEFIGKNEPISSQPSHPFTGIIVSHRKDLLCAMAGLDKSLYNDINQLAQSLFKNNAAKIIYSKWIDIGHESTFTTASKHVFTSRQFNNIEYKKSSNTLIKCSSNVEKLQREANYFNELDKGLRQFYPQLINHYLDDANGKYYLELEYIPYPSLSEIFLFKKFGPASWQQICLALKRAFDLLYKKPVAFDSPKHLYHEKFNNRLISMSNIFTGNKYRILSNSWHKILNINGVQLPCSINDICHNLANELVSYSKPIDLYKGHGDFCFNNILVDPIFGAVKIIDPRGSGIDNRNQSNIDPRYDICKINHSVTCLYDSIVNNLFSIHINESSINIKIYSPQNHAIIQSIFNNIFINKVINHDDLRVITSSLFFSMIPLHAENELRCLAFALIGSTYYLRGNIDLLQ
ncbi:hypothetical protein [Synechococcus sp. A15-24]|uniref:hypothetical protein n=1 Tax=Synechococcus sp. A15-24 TaxID=1050635 RepID=UPI0016443575|nr:hypothetical protein [Synechococcus sp. A15-24]